MGIPSDEVTLTGVTLDEMRPGFYDLQARLADMDVNWTEALLCFPTFPRFCGQTFAESLDKELALQCVYAYNNWMVEEWCGDSRGRLVPLCLVPLLDADLAATEVRRN
ncbi:MAG: amidohydrolase family protein, partial [Acidimicrobiales bacterium]